MLSTTQVLASFMHQIGAGPGAAMPGAGPSIPVMLLQKMWIPSNACGHRRKSDLSRGRGAAGLERRETMTNKYKRCSIRKLLRTTMYRVRRGRTLLRREATYYHANIGAPRSSTPPPLAAVSTPDSASFAGSTASQFVMTAQGAPSALLLPVKSAVRGHAGLLRGHVCLAL